MELCGVWAGIIEVCAGDDAGVFWVLKPDAIEWLHYPVMWDRLDATPLLRLVGGMDRDTLIVMDLTTGRGGMFQPGKSVEDSLAKSKFEVTRLFEPFVEWPLEWNRHCESSRVLGVTPRLKPFITRSHYSVLGVDWTLRQVSMIICSMCLIIWLNSKSTGKSRLDCLVDDVRFG